MTARRQSSVRDRLVMLVGESQRKIQKQACCSEKGAHVQQAQKVLLHAVRLPDLVPLIGEQREWQVLVRKPHECTRCCGDLSDIIMSLRAIDKVARYIT